MTAVKFRSLALSMPHSAESAHMGHPDFRVAGKIFATLGPDETWGMVKLTPAEQAEFLRADPKAFQPASGAWGRRGCTIVHLRNAKVKLVEQAMLAAWQNVAPEKLKRPSKE
jgi:hypothetical protein